jgi:hypothetical protein
MLVEWELASSIAGVLFTILVTIGGFMWKFSSRLARIEFKTDTVWDFLMRRAMSEAVNKGLGTLNSPLIITEDTQKWYNDMLSELQLFYNNSGYKLNDRDLFIEVEHRFGERLLKEVCIPKELDVGACILGAIAVLKGRVAVKNNEIVLDNTNKV